jgi:hypothetical protein
MTNEVIDRVVAAFEHRPDVGGMALPSTLIPVGEIVTPVVAKSERLKTVISKEAFNSQEAIEAISKEIIQLIESKLEHSYVSLYILLNPTQLSGMDDTWGFLIRIGQLSKSGK